MMDDFQSLNIETQIQLNPNILMADRIKEIMLRKNKKIKNPKYFQPLSQVIENNIDKQNSNSPKMLRQLINETSHLQNVFYRQNYKLHFNHESLFINNNQILQSKDQKAFYCVSKSPLRKQGKTQCSYYQYKAINQNSLKISNLLLNERQIKKEEEKTKQKILKNKMQKDKNHNKKQNGYFLGEHETYQSQMKNNMTSTISQGDVKQKRSSLKSNICSSNKIKVDFEEFNKKLQHKINNNFDLISKTLEQHKLFSKVGKKKRDIFSDKFRTILKLSKQFLNSQLINRQNYLKNAQFQDQYNMKYLKNENYKRNTDKLAQVNENQANNKFSAQQKINFEVIWKITQQIHFFSLIDIINQLMQIVNNYPNVFKEKQEIFIFLQYILSNEAIQAYQQKIINNQISKENNNQIDRFRTFSTSQQYKIKEIYDFMHIQFNLNYQNSKKILKSFIQGMFLKYFLREDPINQSQGSKKKREVSYYKQQEEQVIFNNYQFHAQPSNLAEFVPSYEERNHFLLDKFSQKQNIFEDEQKLLLLLNLSRDPYLPRSSARYITHISTLVQNIFGFKEKENQNKQSQLQERLRVQKDKQNQQAQGQIQSWEQMFGNLILRI